jgi:hypothetical protein
MYESFPGPKIHQLEGLWMVGDIPNQKRVWGRRDRERGTQLSYSSESNFYWVI